MKQNGIDRQSQIDKHSSPQLFKNFQSRNQNKQNKNNQFLRKTQKYNPQKQYLYKCLPARFSSHPIYGQLLIKFQSIILHSNMPLSKGKNIIYRCGMMGYQQTDLPYLSQNITYTIHTKNKLFKHYLKDMKMSVVQVLDARNYQPIGHCYINWLTHMKSIQDNEVVIEEKQDKKYGEQTEESKPRYYLPFFDQNCQVKLPVFDFRNQKIFQNKQNKAEEQQNFKNMRVHSKQRIIGQISIKFMCRIYQNPISLGFELDQNDSKQQLKHIINNLPSKNQLQNCNQPNIKYSISPSYLNIPQQNNSLYKNNILSSKTISPSHNKIFSRQFSNNQNIKQYHQQQQSNKKLFPQMKRQLSNFSYQNQNQKIQSNKSGDKFNYQNLKIGDNNSRRFEYNSIYKNKISSPKYQNQKRQSQHNKNKFNLTSFSSNQVQLLQLKMDVKEFFKNDQIQNKKQQSQIFIIVKIKSRLTNINQLDVYLDQIQNEYNNNIMAKGKQLNANKPHVKIYQISGNQSEKSKNQNVFNSQLVVQRPSERLVEIYLPNSLGKCSFRCKDIVSGNNQIFIYNKGNIVGTVVVKKESQKKDLNNKQQSINDFNLKKQLQNQLSKQKMAEKGQKICIVTVQNFQQHFYKRNSSNGQNSHFDNYSIFIKTNQILYQTLQNCKDSRQYFIYQQKNIPNIFGIEVKNSSGQFVGMSQNIQFGGSDIQIIEKNIMPTLMYQKVVNINLKQMPSFKKLPNSISFRLGLFISNTNQLNYFINKEKQNKDRTSHQNENRQSYNNPNNKAKTKKQQKQQQKQKYRVKTVSGDSISQNKTPINKISLKTQTQNQLHQQSKFNKNTKKLPIKLIQKQKQSKLNERYKTQGNYTEDLNSQARGKMSMSQKQHTEQVSMGYQQPPEEEIYLVQFFCKSLHFILGKLGTKGKIQSKLKELQSYRSKNISPNKPRNTITNSEGSSYLSNPYSTQITKQQFQIIISSLIGQNNQLNSSFLDFDIVQILQALFSQQIQNDGPLIKLEQFTLCLMAFYNFLLLASNQKLMSLKQLLKNEPQAVQKLLKIKQSTTNINSQFLWNDILFNTKQKTKNMINRKYKIQPHSPFSVNNLLKDLQTVKYNQQNQLDEIFLNSFLTILITENQKKYQNFINVTAQLASLVKQTVQEIVISQYLTKSQNFSNSDVKINQYQQMMNKSTKFISSMQQKIQTFIKKQKNQNKFQSLSSQQKSHFYFNLTQFQQFFNSININMSLWESLMLIEEIKIWYHSQDNELKNVVETGEGIISQVLLKNWFNSLDFVMKIKNKDGLFRNVKEEKNNSRVKSVKSVDSDDENIIQQINRRNINNNRQQNNNHDFNKKNQNSMNIKYGSNNNPKQMNQKQLNSQKNSMMMKQSQNLNNESDIANIANLLKQNQNNLFFLPSFTQAKTNNKLTLQNIKSNQHILKGLLQENTVLEGPMTLSLKPQYKNGIQDKKYINMAKINNDKQSNNDISEDVSEETERVKSVPVKQQPHYCYLSVVIKQIRLKHPEIVIDKQGLKKITISLKQNIANNNNQHASQQVAHLPSYTTQLQSSAKQSYFIASDIITKIFVQQQKQLLNKYSLSNYLLDINSLNKFQTQFKNGLFVQLSNLLREQNLEGNNKSRQNRKDNSLLSGNVVKKGNKLKEDSNEEMLLRGVLPIQDVVIIIEEFKNKMLEVEKNDKNVVIVDDDINGQNLEKKQNALNLQQNEPSKSSYSKKKTIVLYAQKQNLNIMNKPSSINNPRPTGHSRQIGGKIIAQITISHQKSNLYEKIQPINTNYTTIQLKFNVNNFFNKHNINRKQISNHKSRQAQIQQKGKKKTIRLFYCSTQSMYDTNKCNSKIQKPQQQLTELIPFMRDNQDYQINLPEPILQHQLIFREVSSQQQKFKGENHINKRDLNQLTQSKGQDGVEDKTIFEQKQSNNRIMDVSRFTNFNFQGSRHNQINNTVEGGNITEEECVIPLQTLYFKKKLRQSYPMINVSDGRFVCEIDLQMEIV